MAIPIISSSPIVSAVENSKKMHLYQQQKKEQQQKKGKRKKIPDVKLDSEGNPELAIPDLDLKNLNLEMMKYLPKTGRTLVSTKEQRLLREKQKREWTEYEEQQKALKEGEK